MTRHTHDDLHDDGDLPPDLRSVFAGLDAMGEAERAAAPGDLGTRVALGSLSDLTGARAMEPGVEALAAAERRAAPADLERRVADASALELARRVHAVAGRIGPSSSGRPWAGRLRLALSAAAAALALAATGILMLRPGSPAMPGAGGTAGGPLAAQPSAADLAGQIDADFAVLFASVDSHGGESGDDAEGWSDPLLFDEPTSGGTM
jgi:hypothetical protein